ncbi:hypothetical protein AAC03nite_36540 [Alicyclobacillus acidoterrestris]|nr:hypothetical protein AAC03nite_36540 [Alicyclobacillus acidoterrestris]
MYNVCVIGAGPCGLAVSAELQKHHIHHIVLDKSCIASTIYRFPTQMVFNSTPEKLEIGEIPFYTNGAKPTRHEALTYYRTVVDRLQLPVLQYETVYDVHYDEPSKAYRIHTRTRTGLDHAYFAKNIVIATGYFDNPNWLGVEGEDLPHVSHYYTDAHPYYGQSVVVVGGTNSAAEAVIDLYRIGAKVRLIHRGSELSSKIKPWVQPEIQSLIRNNRIEYYFNSKITRIHPDAVDVQTPNGQLQFPVNHVLALTGYHPDMSFLQQFGIHVDAKTGIPAYNEETYETNVSGIYLAGVIVSGYDANRIFIETGRFHGQSIVKDIIKRSM